MLCLNSKIMYLHLEESSIEFRKVDPQDYSMSCTGMTCAASSAA